MSGREPGWLKRDLESSPDWPDVLARAQERSREDPPVDPLKYHEDANRKIREGMSAPVRDQNNEAPSVVAQFVAPEMREVVEEIYTHDPANDWTIDDSSEETLIDAALGRTPSGLSDPDQNTRGRRHVDAHVVETSAAERAHPNTGSQRRLILDAIAASDSRGMTHDEIAAVPGVSDRAHRTRRKELERGGWVEDSGRTRETVTATDAVVWVLTARGREHYGLDAPASLF